MENLMFHDALNEIWNLVRRTNKYTDETQPWVLVRDENKRSELAGVMYTLAEILRIVSVLIEPFMPNTPAAIRSQLNMADKKILTWESTKTFGLLPKEVGITKGNIIFPRIDMKKELTELAAAWNTKAAPAAVASPQASPQSSPAAAETPMISIDDFDKLALKVGKILECEKVEGSDKLLKSQVKIGGEVRQIVSGIAKHYSPEQMVGKKVVVVTNLKPVKLRGILSAGMILAAEDSSGKLNTITVDGDIEDGAEVK